MTTMYVSFIGHNSTIFCKSLWSLIWGKGVRERGRKGSAPITKYVRLILKLLRSTDKALHQVSRRKRKATSELQTGVSGIYRKGDSINQIKWKVKVERAWVQFSLCRVQNIFATSKIRLEWMKQILKKHNYSRVFIFSSIWATELVFHHDKLHCVLTQ